MAKVNGYKLMKAAAVIGGLISGGLLGRAIANTIAIPEYYQEIVDE